MASSSSASDVWSVLSDEYDSWQGAPSNRRDAECQTDQLPFMMTLAQLIEEERLTEEERMSWARAQAAAVAAPAEAAVVAAPAQAAAQSSAQPPAQLPQLGKKDCDFGRLGNGCGRWIIVNGDTRGTSGCGKRYRR